MPDDPKSAAQPEAKTPVGGDPAIYLSLLEGNQRAFARWLQGMFAVAQEITQFTHSRLEEDMAAWSTLASCGSPEQALDCQRRFAAKAAEQYAEEMGKLSRMMMSLASEDRSPLRPPAAKPK
jgi:phasin family protein